MDSDAIGRGRLSCEAWRSHSPVPDARDFIDEGLDDVAIRCGERQDSKQNADWTFLYNQERKLTRRALYKRDKLIDRVQAGLAKLGKVVYQLK